MSFVFQENLDSQVDAVETVFTVANNISVITDVIFDGAPYIGTITVTGPKEITLGASPIVSLRVSYYTSAPTGTSDLVLVSDAITRFQRAYNDDLGEISNDLYYDWLSDLNGEIYTYLYKNDPTRYIYEVPFTLTVGTDTYSLPSDYQSTTVRGCGFFKNDTSGNITTAQLIESQEGSTQEGFYLGQQTFGITPTPEVSSSITLKYIPKIVDISALTDYLYVDTKYANLVTNYLDKRYSQWNRDEMREMSADARYSKDLQFMLSDTVRKPRIVRFQ